MTAPIKYSQHRDNHTRAYIFIFAAWVASAAIGSPIMLGANHIPQAEEENLSAADMGNKTTVVTAYYVNDTALASNLTSVAQERGLFDPPKSEFVCAFYNPDFIIYSSLGSFYIPCIVMIYLYARIFKVRTRSTCDVFLSPSV